MGKHIRFDWAMKRLLRQKSNFGILEGFLSELILQDIKIQEIIDSESNKIREDDKYDYEAYIKEQRIKEAEIDTAIYDAKIAVEEKLLPLIELERQNAEIERQNAELERQNAKQEQQKAEQERQNAKQERQKAKQEQQNAEQERQKLITTIKNMKADGVSNELIAKYTGEKLEDIEKFLNHK